MLIAALLLLTTVLGETARAQLRPESSQFLYQGLNGLEGTVEPLDEFGDALATGDFNGDGSDDLAIGVQFESVGSLESAGVVQIIYGGTGGLMTSANQLWIQGSNGLPGTAERFDRFGQSLAVGDFNGDGYDDLAAGAPREDIGDIAAAGAVVVIYGSFLGLTADGSQLWSQETLDVLETPEPFDQFGAALAAGDFDGDSIDDLAIGVDGEEIDGVDRAGIVQILYGAATGLTAAGNQLWYQDSRGVPGEAEASDSFGQVLAAGNLNADAYDDLVVGVPEEDADDVSDAGAVNIFFGSSGGITADNALLIDQSTTAVPGQSEIGDRFGRSVAIGNFDDDDFVDLAIGAPYKDVGPVSNAGAVLILLTGESGIATNAFVLHQDIPGVEDDAEDSAFYGWALAVGDFDGDRTEDLAVGAPDHDASAEDAGLVHVFYGDPVTTLVNRRQQIFTQDTEGVADSAELEDFFGESLAAGRFDADRPASLAVGAPGEDLSGQEDAGAVHVIYSATPLIFADGFEP